jgi:Zinc dependent phospholipase C
MPGPYAHITLLHELMRPGRLESIFSLTSSFEVVLLTYFPYSALGAVSPDYPNLVPADGSASRWADAMHYTRACGMITSGIRRVRGAKGATRDKQLAWLLGYCAHVAADVTIHPVVQAKVGVYTENQRLHRICEMNQDSYIYRRMNLGEIGEKDMFALAVAQCSNSENRTELDSDIVALWEGMLADIHPELFVAHPPDSASWHREFVAMVAGCGDSAVRLFPLAGVIAAKTGLAYPAYDAVDRQFVEKQMVPSEKPICLHYDDIFEHAACNVEAVWRIVEQAICAADSSFLPMFEDWNLDSGRDEHGRLVFW